MSELPVLPLWVTKYEGKTAHLSLEEDGAYTRLLRLCWRTPGCTIPSDPAWVMRQMRVDVATYERAVKVVLDEFFVCENGRWQSLRLLAEYTSALEKTQRRKIAGSMGGKAKALNAKETAPSNATILPEQCSSKPYPKPEPYPVIEKEDPRGSSKKTPEPKGSRLPPDWRLEPEWLSEAFEAIPPNQSALTEQEIRYEADKFRDYWHSQPGAKGRKLDWLGTWRNWIRRASPDILRERGRVQRANGSGRNGPGSAHEAVLLGFAKAAGIETGDYGVRPDRNHNGNGAGGLFAATGCEIVDRDDPRGADARVASGNRQPVGAFVRPLSSAGGR